MAIAKQPYTFGQTTRSSRARRRDTAPNGARRGGPETGRISKLSVGQGIGYIRPASDVEIFFHRADLAGWSINDCQVGDFVTFERVDDAVSGPRAQAIRKREPRLVV